MILQSTRVWMVDHFLACQLEISDGLIQAVYPYNEKPVDLDAGSHRILPGFIDVHTHGGYGFDSMEADQQKFNEYTKALCHEGVTSFLISTITESPEILDASLERLSHLENKEGARKLGIHLEGPFLSRKYKGAHSEKDCVVPHIESFEQYVKASDRQIRMITLAAENDHDFSLIHYCNRNGIKVALGHSDITYEKAAMAVANGASSFTHVYNAMPPFHHRKPGLIGTAFNFPGIYGEIICDGIHVHYAAVETFFRLKGPYFSIMISDSLSLKGLQPGSEAEFGPERIQVDANGKIVLEGTDTIAGSSVRLNQALKGLSENTEIPLGWILHALSRNPASFLGVNKGVLQAGKDADVIVVDDQFNVEHCFVMGKQQF